MHLVGFIIRIFNGNMFVFSHWTYSFSKKKKINVEKDYLSLPPTWIKSYSFTGVCLKR